MRKNAAAGILLFLVLSGCTDGNHEAPVTTVEVSDVAREVLIPKAIMSGVADQLATEAVANPLYMFMPVQVQFRTLSPEALSAPNLQYLLPKGGGVIDLKDIVTGFGSFYMSFPPEQFPDKYELLHLYYVSNSPVRTIDGEKFGLGCGKMLDLKKAFGKLQKPQFLKLNTVERRYLAVTAGRYIFIFRQGNQVHIAQLTLQDSRYPQEQCLNEKTGAT